MLAEFAVRGRIKKDCVSKEVKDFSMQTKADALMV